MGKKALSILTAATLFGAVGCSAENTPVPTPSADEARVKIATGLGECTVESVTDTHTTPPIGGHPRTTALVVVRLTTTPTARQAMAPFDNNTPRHNEVTWFGPTVGAQEITSDGGQPSLGDKVPVLSTPAVTSNAVHTVTLAPRLDLPHGSQAEVVVTTVVTTPEDVGITATTATHACGSLQLIQDSFGRPTWVQEAGPPPVPSSFNSQVYPR